ncbi:hypothetical protein CFter6_2098 [Collimonas fungivorans]|uniref:Uncharacterized protein n=1 Tax=Collimonas fungivorans TaxID=158899 RepID=A0A127PAD6_9BURK|nr:hypothetical protein CFter6_2098 [Collimonas fungivorans]
MLQYGKVADRFLWQIFMAVPATLPAIFPVEPPLNHTTGLALLACPD